MMRKLLLLLGLLLSNQVNCQIKPLFLDDTTFICMYEELIVGRFFDLKDSLPDGTYILYDVLKKDSSSGDKRVLLKCNYFNNRKEGLCERNYYFFGTSKNLCYYSNGLKNGTEDMYFVSDNQARFLLSYHFEYSNGKKDGVFIWYDCKGLIEQINIYRMDTLLERTIYFTFDNSSDIKERIIVQKNKFVYTWFYNEEMIDKAEFHIMNGIVEKYSVYFQDKMSSFKDVNVDIGFIDPENVPISLAYVTYDVLCDKDKFIQYLKNNEFKNVFHKWNPAPSKINPKQHPKKNRQKK